MSSTETKITLAVLTWKAPKTLEKSLSSIKDLLYFFDEKILVCQESDSDELKIGERFGFRCIPLVENVGIQYGMKVCFDESSNELVLFYENDLNLKSSVTEAIDLLSQAKQALQLGLVDFVKLRYLPDNRTSKGRQFDKYWKVKNKSVVRKGLGLLRYRRADWTLGGACQYIWEENIRALGFERFSGNFLLSSSKFNKWENRAVLTSKRFFYNLLDFAEKNPTERIINGSPDLEHPINCRKNREWFRKKNFKLLIAVPGVFGHRRYDRHISDEKWGMVDPRDEGGEVSVNLNG